MSSHLTAGASTIDISPVDSQFLWGYPHVERMSKGIHDPLLSGALYLSNGECQVIFITNDIIIIPNDLVARARDRIQKATGVPAGNIMITGTHTHSGPMTKDYISNEADPVVPPTDPKYVQLFEDGIVAAAQGAFDSAVPAELGLAVAEAKGVGTNRRDPSGPADPAVPVMLVRNAETKASIACMMLYSMHPTVLHEDNKLVSGDFPAMCRQYLQQAEILGPDCPVLYHTGPEGNQSPRHVVNGQTFEEAQRLGSLLGQAVQAVLPTIQFSSDISLSAQQGFVELPRKQFPDVEQAEANLKAVVEKLARQRSDGTDRATVRTTECDWFGAEEVVVLAKAQQEGRLDVVASTVMPAEIQIISVGQWKFVGWPGEIFIEYALALKAKSPNTFIANLANGDLQGYLVTAEAAAEGGYEASNAMFSHESGQILVDKTLDMIKTIQD